LIHLDDGSIFAADQEQGWGHDLGQISFRKVRSSAA
jgi:hypothetical protein